ncbi:MAG: PAS domain S-box protein [Nitrospirae bacterium]|nr:PAS domain S-box protein [Nitrospirota bacterium]
MTLRTRITFMLSVFLILIAILGTGTILIFENLSRHMGTLSVASAESKLISDLERNISDFVEDVRDWGITGEARFRRQFTNRLSDVYRNLGVLSVQSGHKADIDILSEKFYVVLGYARIIMDKRDPAGDHEVAVLIRKIESLTLEIVSAIDTIQESSVKAVSNVALSGEKTRRRMITYHLSLIGLTSIISFILIISIRRAIASPFNELLKATEKISAGDLSYRIRMERSDEFGVVAARFDDMVTDLEASSRKLGRKLNETELLLDIARIAGSTLDRKTAFVEMAGILAGKLNYGICSIYMRHVERKAFLLDASNDPAEGEKRFRISTENRLFQKIISSLEPVIFKAGDFSVDGEDLFGEKGESGLAMPITRENSCVGMIVIRNRQEHVFSDDEISTLRIVSHTIGSVFRNSELYDAARNQILKMTVLFDLSRAITSLLDSGQLLKKITEEMSRLVSSRGCIIRLLEENKLKIRASYGLQKELEPQLELSLGEGIAGWVAQHNESMLVEDTKNIAANMKTPGIDIKTVICVPLIVGQTVIGTLSLYDKLDSQGKPIPFAADDLNTVEGFASISSIAIEKARIYETEISRQKQALDEKKRLNILFDSVQGGIITLDRNFMITSANKFVEEWMGLSNPDLIGKDSLAIFHDRIGICPHCAAKATFETGEINTITQSRGVNYAELTAYPIMNEQGEIAEAVVFILDITERILYQEETLSLYREVIQTKDYLESIIDNSADAIVTSDLAGIVTSWNLGAERTFGFVEHEVKGKFLPFVPDFLLEKEKEHIDRLKKGEVLKDIETLRKKMDGSIIEVSLTLSPIKDAAGEVIGICGISRDISEKKRVEKELIRRNQEMSRLFFISAAMRSTLELDKLLRMVLTAVTMSDGMGFNRAILFLVDDEREVLKGVMGVGPATPEEAWKVWDDLSLRHKTLDNIMQDIISNPVHRDSFLERLTVGIELSLNENTILTKSVKEKLPFNVLDVRQEALSDAVLIQQLGTQAYAVVPLIARDKVIGLIWVDNYFNRKAVTDEDMQFLASFSNQIASAIESARLYEQMTMAEQQLENIFESMSDMVYFNSSDYVVKRVNKAVINRLGLSSEQILGKKCYELFHGTSEPLGKCPHHKTVNTMKAYVEELDEPHLGGTFLTSSSPIFDTSGEFIGSVHVVRDITELKQLQEKVGMSEKMAALGEVAAKVAHEIRNPLVSVGGFAKRLEKKLDGNLKEYAGIIVKEVSRLEGILREILGFVKEVRLARELVGMNDIVDDIIQLMQSDMSERGISLQREYQAVPEIFIDPNRIKEAIVNIITNAMQALQGTGTITVRTYVREGSVVLEVRDTGKGIPAAEINSIFNPFFTTKSSGTGLGLAITHRIIQEHDGQIEVESEVDKGTVFRISIPIKEKQT